jgi:hypothetical protein
MPDEDAGVMYACPEADGKEVLLGILISVMRRPPESV